jgi:hypothetical protein
METVLIVIAGIVGFVFGLLFAVSGWTDSGKTDDFSKTVRVKNFLWLIGGVVTVVFGDWKVVVSSTQEDVKGWMLLAYLAGAMGAAILGVLAIAITIALTASARKKSHPSFGDRTGELVLEYIQYGYRYYRGQLDRIDKEVATAAALAASQSLSTPQSLQESGKLLATLIAVTTSARDEADPNLLERYIDQVLIGIEDTVKLFASNVRGLRLRTNYMVEIVQAQVDVTPMFASGPLDKYRGFLRLRRYRDREVGPICLPVETKTRAIRILPGAPACVFKQSACLINTKDLKFESGVPKAVQTEVKKFFNTKPYASVLSVPVILGTRVIGVANVESSHIDVVDLGFDMVERIADALVPFCMVLGELVNRTEELR